MRLRLDRNRLIDVLISLLVGLMLVCLVRIQVVARLAARVEQRVTGGASIAKSELVQQGVELMDRWSHAVENAAYDLRLALRARLAPRHTERGALDHLLFVEIDDASLERVGRWPWPRDRQAQLIEGLKLLGARGVFTDIEYPEPSAAAPGARDPDAALAQALARSSSSSLHAAAGAAFGVTFLETARTSGESRAREHARRRLREWAALAATEKRPQVPAPLRDEIIREGHGDVLAEADLMLRVARHLSEQPLASHLDLAIAGVLPDAKPPAPPADAPLHTAQVLPAVLQATLLSPPGAAAGSIALTALRTMGYGQKFIDAVNGTPFGREYLPALAEYCRRARGALARLDYLDDVIGDALKERWIREAQRAHPEAADATILRVVSERMGMPDGEVDPRLRWVLEHRRSRDLFTSRHLLPARAEWLAPLPVLGKPQPPVPVIAAAYRGLGISTVEHDVGGILRRQRLLFRVESSALDLHRDAQPARLAFHATLPIIAYLADLDLKKMELGDEYLRIPARGKGPSLTIPVDEQARVLIDFRGKWQQDGFDRINALAVLTWMDDRERRERWHRKSDNYHGPAVAAEWLGKLAADVPIALPGGEVASIQISRTLEALRAHGLVELERQAQLNYDVISRDVKSLLDERDRATREGNAAEIREIDQMLVGRRETHDLVMARLPLLETSLRQQLRGRFCLVGVTSTGTTDVSAIPLQEQYVNIGVHANLVEQMLTGSYLIKAPWIEVDLPILLGCLILIPLVVPVLSIRKGALAVLFLVTGHIGLSTLLLIHRGVWIDATTPVAAMLLGYMGITLRRYLMEERQKIRIRSMFSTYLDRRVVEAMIADPSVFEAMGGQSREITAFFSDIEGFTTISELLDSDELATMLQDYLTPMTASILEHNGLRDKYIGDAIVGIFGAPVPSSDHAAQACLASIEQLESMAELKRQWHRAGTPWYVKIRERGLDLNFRIGLNTGRAKVGNFGSRDAKNYTMIGDTVNLASRLEGANKGYKTRIMISETTYQHARAVIEARELDLLRVVGKLQPVTVYEVLGRRGEVAPELVAMAARFKEALDLYRAKRFDDARKIFAELRERFPEDGPIKTYVKRLDDREFLTSLPPDWDGAFVSKEK